MKGKCAMYEDHLCDPLSKKLVVVKEDWLIEQGVSNK